MNPVKGQLWRWGGEEYRVLRAGEDWADVQKVAVPAWRKRQRLPFPEGAELIGDGYVEAFGGYAIQPPLFDLEEVSA